MRISDPGPKERGANLKPENTITRCRLLSHSPIMEGRVGVNHADLLTKPSLDGRRDMILVF